MEKCRADLGVIIGLKDSSNKLNIANAKLLRANLPDVWNVYIEGNAELKIEKDFEQFLFAVAEHTTKDVEELSTYKFYHLVLFIKGKEVKAK